MLLYSCSKEEGRGRERDICEYINKVFSFSFYFLFGNVKAAPYEYTYQQTPKIFISNIV